MFTKEAIQELTKAESIHAANTSVEMALKPEQSLLALPNDFATHDLEKYLPNRRRARGAMETTDIESFAIYATAYNEPGAKVFVSPAMVANAVLNLGTTDKPGHADNRAQFKPRATAAYNALRKIAGGQALTQQAVAEYIEDWSPIIKCFHDSEPVSTPKAIAAVRNITIDAMRKVEASEQQLSASRSAFESVTATSKDTLPTYIYVDLEPYHDFKKRTFVLRLGIITTEKPAITLRIQNIEQHEEDMANELVGMVKDAIHLRDTSDMQVLVGDYTAK